MSRWSRWLGVSIVAITLAVLLSACRGGDEDGGEEVAAGGGAIVVAGSAAPTFELPTADGSSVALPDDVRGRPTLLYFSMGPG